MTKSVQFKKRGGPYDAKAVYGSKEAWFYTNGGSITVVIQGADATTSCRIPLRTLKKAVGAMS